MKHLLRFALIFALVATLSFASCNSAGTCSKATTTESCVPEWSKDATLYEVNLRQFTNEGTIAAFRQHLPRLQQLGVRILWFMPIHPIGEADRKGTLGSYYAISDYRAVNPEFGTMNEFKAMVNQAHSLGMKVILDWVPNHTSRDHLWLTEHPHWYVYDANGKPAVPYDWTDVAQLNFADKDMQREMIDAMVFWVAEANVDGFRCDVARLAPDYTTEEQAINFWLDARKALEAVKPVFMLAEDEGLRTLIKNGSFEGNYAWEAHHLMGQIAQGKANVKDLQRYFERELLNVPKSAYRMMFTSNHDENSWAGTEFMRMGNAAKTMAVLSFTIPGFPLIYSGQEVGLKRSLDFFEKDVICWNDPKGFTSFYQNLTALKTNHSALHNGDFGADMVWVNHSEPEKVLMFVREDEHSKVFCVFNLSADLLTSVEPRGDAFYGTYEWAWRNLKVEFAATPSFILNPWEYRVYTMKKDSM